MHINEWKYYILKGVDSMDTIGEIVIIRPKNDDTVVTG